MNNNWDQHITNVIKKAKQRFYMLQKQGVQWKQLDPLSCIHLIKTIISPILHYGVEIMDLYLILYILAYQIMDYGVEIMASFSCV